MASAPLIRVSTKKPINVFCVNQTRAVQYPNTWFENNPGKKPPVTVRTSKICLEEMRRGLLYGLEHDGMDRELATCYMVELAKGITESLDSDWISYGVKIGDKGETITPLSILDLVVSNTELPQFSVCNPERDEPDKNILLVILCIHRLLRTSNIDARKRVIENLRKQLEKKVKTVQGLTHSHANKLLCWHLGWQGDRDYHKLVAAFDMFFHKFPNHKFAAVRFGSMSSRYRDCAALSSIAQVCDLLGIKPESLPAWIYTKQLADEFEQIMNTSNSAEASADYSYFPYQSDLGLVSKTAYSSVANPNLYFFLHVAGTLSGSVRSKHARQNTYYNLENNTLNAIILANAFKRNIQKGSAFTIDEEEFKVEGSETELSKEFVSTNGSEWFVFMKKNKFKLSRDMKTFIMSVKTHLGPTREGTVGRYIENYNVV